MFLSLFRKGNLQVQSAPQRRRPFSLYILWNGNNLERTDRQTTDLMERKKTAQLRSMPLSQAASPETHPAVPTDRGTLLLPPSESAVKLTTLTFKRRP